MRITSPPFNLCLGDSHDIHVFELDTKRLAKPEWPKKVADIQKAIADIEPDVAILGDDNAFSLMADHLVEREIPVVFLGVNGGTGAHERYDAVVLGTHHTIRDQDGEYVTPQELLEEAFHKAQLPLFSFWDIFVGEKQSIGGFTISAHQEGLTAARLASLILKDVKPDRIPHLKSLSGHYVYSESGLKHWNLELSPLIASKANFVD